MAQKKGSTPVNPAAEARKRALDSTRAAQQAKLEAQKAERKQKSDSIAAVRKHRSDSLAAVRKYKESKQYKRQVEKARQQHLDSIQNARKVAMDAIKAQRQKVLDSTIAARKAVVDALKEKQKKRTDSLAAIRKYRESKRYQDSVVVVRKQRSDSIKAVRQAFNDSVATSRKIKSDSMAAVRKAITDSTTAARTKYMDSIKAVRKVRTDSLAKVKEKREKNAQDRLKNREEKMKLALELKIAKKRQAWSNEKMLKKRWSPPRKAIQNTFTRYNYYFNADNKMDEALENMQRMKKENYDSLLALFPFDPDKDSATLAPDMDSIIQKASIGIQIHDPRTKWGDDLYLLLGQAYYYKGDYENAGTAFKYIVAINEAEKNKANKAAAARGKKTAKGQPNSIMQAEDKSALDFLKHRSVHNESLLWLARTYTESRKEGEAESVLALLATDPNLPENLKGRLALEKAYVNLSQNDYKNATENLAIVQNDNELPGWVRQRAAFINGQLLYERGDYVASAASYDKVIDLHPKIDMDFYARKNMAYSLMMSGGAQEDAVASLRKILKDGKYVSYYEQVYYVIGRLYANSGKYDEAIEYLNKGISAPRASKKQKAMAFASLGNVYYTQRNYNTAKQYYDSASVLASSAPDDSTVAMALRRGLVLGDITRPANLIHNQDSLLALAAMSDREQRAEVRRYIAMLQRRINDSIFAAENAGLNSALQASANAGGNNQQGGANYTNWYFVNPVLMQQGQNEFKRKWGGRPLVDKWRRAASISLTSKQNTTESEDGSGGDVEFDENGLPTEESLLAFIPNGPERKENALKMIRRAYVDLADAYIKRLEDYPEAIHALDTLDKRFPAHEHKAEELYLRYLVALRQSKNAEMQSYASQLLQQYPDSKWAALVKPTEDNAAPSTLDGLTVSAYHDETYNLLLQRQYSEALMRAREGQKKFNDNRYYKKFRIIESIGLVGTLDYDRADTVISDFIKKYPLDSLRPWADMVLEYIKKWRIANPPAAKIDAAVSAPGAVEGSAPGTAPGTAPPPGSQPSAADLAAGNKPPGAGVPPPPPLMEEKVSLPPPKAYSYNAKEAHYILFTYPGMEQRAMGVKAAIGDFNTFKYGSLGLDVESTVLNQKEGVIAVQKFDGPTKAKIYMNDLRGTAQVFREYKTGEYQLLLISESNYRKLLADNALGPYLDFYSKNYK